VLVHQFSDDRVYFAQLHLGGDRNFCYLLGDRRSGTAAAVDPGYSPDRLAAAATAHNLKITSIAITHSHSDHVGAAKGLASLTGAGIYASLPEDVPGSRIVNDGDQILLGETPILVYLTPGHSPGHACFLFENRLMTGDLLFCGKVGGTGQHFPGSSTLAEWKSLQRIVALNEDIEVFPGHNYYGGEGTRTHSTIGHEKRNNPFLLCESYEDFCSLKDNWDTYKATHRIR
jgi:glyoxylase-like metal-dependent hydrolase (beta-lactamase superfamily II)